MAPQDDQLRLEQDVIAPLAEKRKLYVYETTSFWRQIKTAGYETNLISVTNESMTVRCRGQVCRTGQCARLGVLQVYKSCSTASPLAHDHC